MGPDGFLELVAHDHAGTLSRRTAREHHDTGTSVRECGLQRMNGRKIDTEQDTHLEKTNRDTDSDSSAPERTLVVRNRPGITRQCFQKCRSIGTRTAARASRIAQRQTPAAWVDQGEEQRGSASSVRACPESVSASIPSHHGRRMTCCIRRTQAHGLASDRKSTRLNSSHSGESRMPSSA